MKIVLGSDGSVELTRGEHITRGQNKSRQVLVEWAEGVSPIDTGQFLADNMVVEMCITRPDGEQSGWQTAVKIDGEIKYQYILQAWDTAVSGQAKLQVRWYDITLSEMDSCTECGAQILEDSRIIEVSNEAFFIIDNGKIAQPLNLSSENYNDIVLQFITPLSTQAFRKYNVNALPDTVIYEPDGAKTAPALFYNFTHEVVDLVDEEFNEQRTVREGFLFVGKCGEIQTEVFFSSVGKIYTRSFAESPAGDFKERFEEKLLYAFNSLSNYQKEIDNALETESKEIVGAINEVNTNLKALNIKNGEGGGSIVQKQSTEEGKYVTGSNGRDKVTDSTAKGASAVALNVRNNANGDASVVGGYSSTANTKADVAFNNSNAGITEANYYKIYPKGYLLGSEYLTYEQYKKRVVNSAFSCNNGKAIGIKTFSAGSHAVIDVKDTQGNKTGQIETGSFAENSATFGQNCRTVVSFDEEGKEKENARNSLVGGTASSVHGPNSFGYGKSLTIPTRVITHDGKQQEIATATFGQFNQQYHPDYVTILEVGNGKSDKKDAKGLYTEHSNAFEVLFDGRAKVQSAPQDDNDVVRLLELKKSIANIDKLTYKVVNSLPTTGESNIIYLVPNTQSADKNVKDEYMWINGTWELIGSTAIDLSDYQKKTDNSLKTESKEIVGAINEVNDNKLDKVKPIGNYIPTFIALSQEDDKIVVARYGGYHNPNKNAQSVAMTVGGRLKTEAPLSDKDCINKKFLEEQLENITGGTQLYKHEMIIRDSGMYGVFSFLSTESEVYVHPYPAFTSVPNELLCTIQFRYGSTEDLQDNFAINFVRGYGGIDYCTIMKEDGISVEDAESLLANLTNIEPYAPIPL